MKIIITESQGLLIIEAPHTFWTDELLKQIASMYNSRGSLQLGNQAAYRQIKKRGLLDSFYPLDVPHIKWTPEKLKDESSKYNTTQEFLRNNPAAYSSAYRKGILNDLIPKTPNKWTEESIKQEASKYKTKKEFELGNQYAYITAHKLRIIDDLFPGKISNRKGQTKYTDEDIRKESLKYQSSADFRKNNFKVWSRAYYRGMIPDLYPKK